MSINAITAERQFEAGHLRRLQLGFLFAIGIHVLLFLVLPHPHFEPYRLAEKTVAKLVDAPLEFVIPPPPAEIPKKDIVTAIEPSNASDAEETIGETVFDPDAHAAVPVPVSTTGYADFFDRPPVLIERVDPVYPEMARQAELEGVVLLKVGIDEFGQVREALVLKSVPGLDEAALDAIYRWKFQPAMQRDVPVPVWYSVPIRFSLRD